MRHTQRLTARNGALLVVDLQEKLLAAIADRELVVANVVHLIHGASIARIAGLVHGTVSQRSRSQHRQSGRLDRGSSRQVDLSLLCRPPAPGTALRP